MVSVFVLFILLGFIISYLNPRENAQKSRDQKRLSDLQSLASAIDQYSLVHNTYPDQVDTTRISTALPVGSGASLQTSTGGWIFADLSVYTTKLPTDPLNDVTYYYSYRHNAGSYELNALLEFPNEISQNDGGNDPGRYEIGNNLSLL
jgi:type II secretory pathway pseudopilin PulG